MSEIEKIRYDERLNVFAREDLLPEIPEYEEFYRQYPELKEADDYFRSLPGCGANMPQADKGMFFSPAKIMYKLGMPDAVDGKPAEQAVKLSPDRAAEKVRIFAKRLGADMVGFSKLNPAYIYSHRGRIKYSSEPRGEKITNKHKYAISLGFEMDIDIVRTGPRHSEMTETGIVYYLSTAVSVVLADYIRSLGYSARAHHFRNYEVLPVPIAVDAGLGELGRCGFLLTEKYGNCLRLATVTTDLPLACDSPVDIGVQDFCQMCRLCADSCPSGAIPMGEKTLVRGVKKWQLDAVKCISYWNKVGTDCGMCIASCPWSAPHTWYHTLSSKMASRSHLARVLLLWLYPIVYGKFKPRPMPGWFDK